MKRFQMKKSCKGQVVVEYILLLTTVVAVILIGFRIYLPRIQSSGNVYMNRAAYGIVGNPSRCGDTICDNLGIPPLENCQKCPEDCGNC